DLTSPSAPRRVAPLERTSLTTAGTCSTSGTHASTCVCSKRPTTCPCPDTSDTASPTPNTTAPRTAVFVVSITASLLRPLSSPAPYPFRMETPPPRKPPGLSSLLFHQQL